MTQLLIPLSRFSRRQLVTSLATGLGWGLVAAAGILLAGVWLDILWELPPEPRIASAVLAGLAPFAGIALGGRHGWRRSRPMTLARRADRAAAAEGQIASAIDLELNPASESGVSRGLAEIAAQHASSKLIALPAGHVVPWRPLVRATSAVLVFAAVIGAIAWGLPRLVDDEYLRWADPFGDHPPYSRYVFQIDPGSAKVIYGSSIDLRAQVEGGSVEKLDLMWLSEGATAPASIPMFPEKTGLWRATLAGVTTPGRYWVRAAGGRSVRHQIDVITIPEIRAAHFRVEFPSYANVPVYEGPLPQGGLVGLPGTSVTVRLESNRPLARGEIVFDDNSTVALVPMKIGGTEVSGQFVMQKAGKLRWTVEDVEGQKSASASSTVGLLTDEAPRVRLVEPPPLSFATPTAGLPVKLVGEDDYGLAKVSVFRSLNDSRPLASLEKLPTRLPKRWLAQGRLPLSAYGLEVGDEIKIHGRAEDALPGQPNSAETTIAVVRIISQSDFDKLVASRQSFEMLQSKYRSAQRRFESARSEVEKLRRKSKDALDDKGREELARELEALAKQLEESSRALANLAKQEGSSELDELLKKHLESSARQLRRLGEKAHAMSKSKGPPAEMFENLDELMRALQEAEDELEREAMTPLETLAAIRPFMEQASWIEVIYRRQKALVAKLEAMQTAQKEAKKEPARNALTESSEHQQQTRTMLVKVLDELSDLAESIDAKKLDLEDFVEQVKEFTQKWRKSGVLEAMASAEKELAGAVAATGLEKGTPPAQRALKILEDLLKQKSPEGLGQGGIAGPPGRPRFAPGMRDALGKLLVKMMAGQGRGPSSGMGDGQGESASRSPLDNVGLFGSHSSAPESELSLAGSNNPKQRTPGATREKAGSAPSSDPVGENPALAPPAAASDAAIPLIYRRRVAEYLQRIAEESERR